MIVARSYEAGKEQLLDFYAYQQASVLRFQSGIPPQILASDSINGTYQLLRDTIRVNRQQLPPSLGGTFNYSQFDDWIRARISIEDCMGSAPPVINNSLLIASLRRENTDISCLPPSQPIDHWELTEVEEAATIATAIGDMPMDASITSANYGPDFALKPYTSGKRPEKLPTKRCPTASSTRHTYQRQNLAISNLTRERNRITSMNEYLRRENRRVESLLAQARLVVSLHLK